LTAAEWYAESKKDEAGFKEKFKGKVIELTGTVQRSGEDSGEEGHGFVVLAVEDSAAGVMCVTKDRTPWLKVCEGSRVTMRGKKDDSLPDLVECDIAEAGPNPGIMVSAKELTGDFSAGADAAQAKYEKKPLYVEGEVVVKTPIQDGVGTLLLKGDGKLLVACRFSKAPAQKFAALKAGSKIKVLGQFNPNGDKKEVRIDVDAMAELP
jgi:hypothetical protein